MLGSLRRVFPRVMTPVSSMTRCLGTEASEKAMDVAEDAAGKRASPIDKGNIPPPGSDRIRDVTFGDVSMAAYRIRPRIPHTVCRFSRKLSHITGSEIYCKKEFELTTGSFKERGARNALMMLAEEHKTRGVIAASAGNHAQALAYHGRDLGIPVTVVMPKIAPLTKIQNCRDYGATVLLEGNHLGESRQWALEYGRERDLWYINGYDDPDIIAGAGTVGLEIVEQVPDVDAVVVPVGGAGLIAGIALAVKTLRPNCQVIGVEPNTVGSLTKALEMGEPTLIAPGPTLADGLLVPKVGDNGFKLCQQYVDKVVLVRERFIALAMLRLMEMEKNVVEGGGATGLAALLQGVLPELAGKKLAVPLCGGNVDTVTMGRVIERGLAADGRLVRFVANVSDRPGGVAALTRALADLGVSIRDIFHERAWVDTDISMVQVKIVAETTSAEHAEDLYSALQAQGYDLDVTGPRSASVLKT